METNAFPTIISALSWVGMPLITAGDYTGADPARSSHLVTVPKSLGVRTRFVTCPNGMLAHKRSLLGAMSLAIGAHGRGGEPSWNDPRSRDAAELSVPIVETGSTPSTVALKLHRIG